MSGDDPGRATDEDPSEDSNAGGEKTEKKVNAKDEGSLDGAVEWGRDEHICGDISVGKNANDSGAPEEAVQLDEHVDGAGGAALIIDSKEDGGDDDDEEARSNETEPILDQRLPLQEIEVPGEHIEKMRV